MSRARPYRELETGITYWFDYRNPVATPEHLELLADVEQVDLDDLIDAGLSQRQVLFRLHEAEKLIPALVIERRNKRLEKASIQPVCRICDLHGWECEGKITRHHFVPRWLMRELDHYQRYAAKSRCTVPVCIGRHRDLHYRDNDLDKSIVQYLTSSERELAEEILLELKDEHPAIFELISGGSTESYEYSLVRDFLTGRFRIHGEIEGP